MGETLTYIGFGIFFVPVAVGWARRRHLTADQRALVGWIVFIILFSIISEIVGRCFGNNIPLYHLYTIAEFFFLCYLFRRLLKRLPTIVRLLPVLLFLGVGIWGVLADPFAFPDRLRSVESLILIGCALLFFYHSLRSLDVDRIERTFMFWVSVAVLLYFTGNLLLYIFSNYIATASDRVYFTVWTIHTLFNILLYLLYGVALLCRDPIPRSSPSSL